MSSETAKHVTEIGYKAIKEKLKNQNREYGSRKRTKHDSTNSDTSTEKPSKAVRKKLEIETDPIILQRRQKQIDYGKNTVGYYNYIQQVPIDQRQRDHPRTPDKYVKYSRRGWDMLIKMWRIKLHSYDPKKYSSESEPESDDNSDK